MDKISFIGDLMFEMPYIESKKLMDGGYDFSGLLINIGPILQQSDLVVANLETVFAGKESGFTANLYSFNTPDAAIKTLKECYITLVTTANNHCLDRGVQGLKRTIEVLQKNRIDSTGTYLNAKEKQRSFIKEINGTRYAFMSYTYGTNTLENKVLLSDDEIGHVNLLKPQKIDKLKRVGKKQSYLVRLLTICSQKLFTSEARMFIKKMMGMPLNVPIVDDNISINSDYVKVLTDDIKETKMLADIVFMCLHSGGQFNAMPGSFTKNIAKIIHDAGVENIVATHPHVVQHYERNAKGSNVFYSIGSLNISPSSAYVLHDLKPEYSIIPHYYFDKIGGLTKLIKTTFSIVKVVEDKNHSLCVYPISKLRVMLDGKDYEHLMDDVRFIYNRVMQAEINSIEIKDEYEIKY